MVYAILIPLLSSLFCVDAFVAATQNRKRKSFQHDAVSIQDFQPGNGKGILELLTDNSSGFDPEGPLAVDCASEAAIEESYCQDGGCFLVAFHDAKQVVVGTAGLVVGTPISYMQSGASMSTATVTGAVRRVCCSRSVTTQCDSVLRLLLAEIESRAADADVDELVILAYPQSDSCRPSTKLLKALDYKQLPEQLSGINAIQFGKRLNESVGEKRPLDQKPTVSGDSGLAEAVIGGIPAVILLVVSFGVADLMGLDVTSMTDNNRGFGSPLSSQELDRLILDETLKRTDLDGESNNAERQWQDLSREEQQEEAALMKIIQGKDIRLK